MNAQFALRSVVLAAALVAPVAAHAALGLATGSVNMRTGPGTGYAKITTIPAGARLEVGRCSSWCQVVFRGTPGYVSAKYVNVGYVNFAPRNIRRPLPPMVGYYQKPYWDDQAQAWYDGRRWYSNGRWYNSQPGFSLTLNFGQPGMKPPRENPRPPMDGVCLVTFNSPAAVDAGANVDVIRARLLPRDIAESREGGASRIFEYGANTASTCQCLNNPSTRATCQ